MKCFVIRDLLPEYSEGLCSEETKVEIDKHLSGCEECKSFYKEMSEDPEKLDEKSEETRKSDIKPFSKIQHKLKHLTIRNIIISIMILIICAVFGTLTFYQFNPELGGISYDSIKYYQKAKAITKSFADGDMETFLQGMLYGLDTGGQLNMSIYTHTEDFYNDVLKDLKTLYDDSLSGKNVEIKVGGVEYYTGDVSEFYSNMGNGHGCGYSAWTYIYVNELCISMYIYMYNDDGYGVFMTITDTSEDFSDNEYFTYEENVMEDGSIVYHTTYNYSNDFLCTVSKLTDYVNYFQDTISYNERSVWEVGLMNRWNWDESKANSKVYGLFSSMFSDDCFIFDPEGAYSSQMTEKLVSLMPKITVNESRMSHTGYDTEKKRITAVLFWSFTDKNGHNGILQKNFYYGPYGYEAVDDSEILLSDEGMDTRLQEQLRELFD